MGMIQMEQQMMILVFEDAWPIIVLLRKAANVTSAMARMEKSVAYHDG
jgi:hypothetical protein